MHVMRRHSFDQEHDTFWEWRDRKVSKIPKEKMARRRNMAEIGRVGHHFQIALSQENEGSHIFEKLATVTSYVEGWGLYSEYLGEEMGYYSDPLLYFGRLAGRS
jgi:uncharacterized protein (DUF885 family)